MDWSSEPPTVVRAWRKVIDEQILALCEEVTRQRGRVSMPPAERAQLGDEHIFDALVAALTARAVAVGATDPPSPGQADLAAEEGWIHVPSPGHELAQLAGRAPMLD